MKLTQELRSVGILGIKFAIIPDEKLNGDRKMSVIIVIIFLAIIMGIGIKRNRKTSVISELPLSKLDENKLVLK